MPKIITKYVNNGRSSISSAITATATTIPVTDITKFPVITNSTEHFFVTLDGIGGIEVVKVNGVSGSSLINCERGQEGTTAKAYLAQTTIENRLTAGNIVQFARLQDRLRALDSITQLESPQNSDGNSFLTTETDPSGTPILGVSAGDVANLWRFINYPDVVYTGTATAASTTSSLVVSGATVLNQILVDTTPKMYIVQFSSGPLQGRCRFITSVSSTAIGFGVPLPSTPAAGTTFGVYRAMLAWKGGKGNGVDQAIIENSASIWSSYTIGAGRNAVSGGPISIQTPAIVTVGSGSAWTIV